MNRLSAALLALVYGGLERDIQVRDVNPDGSPGKVHWPPPDPPGLQAVREAMGPLPQGVRAADFVPELTPAELGTRIHERLEAALILDDPVPPGLNREARDRINIRTYQWAAALDDRVRPAHLTPPVHQMSRCIPFATQDTVKRWPYTFPWSSQANTRQGGVKAHRRKRARCAASRARMLRRKGR